MPPLSFLSSAIAAASSELTEAPWLWVAILALEPDRLGLDPDKFAFDPLPTLVRLPVERVLLLVLSLVFNYAAIAATF
jgi:hypothetical protein